MSTETKLISCLLMVEMQGLAQMTLARCSGKLALLLPVLHLLLLIERFHFFSGLSVWHFKWTRAAVCLIAQNWLGLKGSGKPENSVQDGCIWKEEWVALGSIGKGKGVENWAELEKYIARCHVASRVLWLFWLLHFSWFLETKNIWKLKPTCVNFHRNSYSMNGNS